MNNKTYIPVANRLISPGNPALKVERKDRIQAPSHIEELNARIDALENAIGQSDQGPIGRAYAIRAERSCDKDSDASVGHLFPKKPKTSSS